MHGKQALAMREWHFGHCRTSSISDWPHSGDAAFSRRMNTDTLNVSKTVGCPEVVMNLFDEIVGGRSNPLQQMEQSFGLDQETVGSVIKQFLPALTNGVKKNISQEGGLQGLLGALSGGGHDRYLEGATSLSRQESVQDGNGILGHLLGSKDVSRQLATRTSEKTGVDSTILKKMLPLVAGLVMGALNKRLSSQSASSGSGLGGLLGSLLGGSSGSTSSTSSTMGTLMQLLDADGESSPIDDLLGLAKGFLR